MCRGRECCRSLADPGDIVGGHEDDGEAWGAEWDIAAIFGNAAVDRNDVEVTFEDTVRFKIVAEGLEVRGSGNVVEEHSLAART